MKKLFRISFGWIAIDFADWLRYNAQPISNNWNWIHKGKEYTTKQLYKRYITSLNKQ